MFRFIKQHLRTVGLRGLWCAMRAMVTQSTVLVRIEREAIRFPFHLRVNTSDIPTCEQLFKDHEYDFTVATPPRTIVDAGANIGLVSIYFANQWPEAKIIAIEPEMSNFAMLQKNTAPYANIHPVNAALWNQDSHINLIDTGLGNWSFMTEDDGAPARLPGHVVHPIKALTVDTVLERFELDKIDIFKIDIEGAEKEVFADTSSWIDKVDAMIIELHENMKPGCLRSFYNGSNGFDSEWQQGENVCLSRGAGLQKRTT